MHPVDDHDVHRFEDDGGNILPFRVGVPPEPKTTNTEPVILKLHDVRAEKPRNRDRRIVLPGETESIGISRAEDRVEAPKILDAQGEEVSSLTWPSFLAWRKTKCRPYDYECGPRFAMKAEMPLEAEFEARRTGEPWSTWTRARALEEIDQAVHEFVGEVAELGQLFMERGPLVFFGADRAKLIDECGDIFFCGAWALDAWGNNPLYEADDLEMLRVSDDNELAVVAGILAGNDQEDVLSNGRFVSMFGQLIMRLMLTAQTNAGLLCNAFKKLRYQRREQDVEIQVARVASVLIAVNQILVIANSSVEEALQFNQRKLDARYPDGYQPGQGGGIRTGEGA